nr:TatD family hydrolase [Candidatus Ozemobacteraceae bacterium]
MNGLIDTHAHLQDEAFAEDFEAIVEKIAAAEPAAVINAGTDFATSPRAVEIARMKPWFWALAG